MDALLAFAVAETQAAEAAAALEAGNSEAAQLALPSAQVSFRAAPPSHYYTQSASTVENVEGIHLKKYASAVLQT